MGKRQRQRGEETDRQIVRQRGRERAREGEGKRERLRERDDLPLAVRDRS